MSYGYMRQGAAMYQQTRTHGGVEGADPHQLTGMLFDGAIERISQARGHLQRGDVAAKGHSISRALAIVGELRDSLDHTVDRAFSQRLDALYEYVTRRLLAAQLDNDTGALDEAVALLTPVRDGWREGRNAYLAGTKPAAGAA